MTLAVDPKNEWLLYCEIPSASGSWTLSYTAGSDRSIRIRKGKQIALSLSCNSALQQYLQLAEYADWIRAYTGTVTDWDLIHMCKELSPDRQKQ